MQQTLKIPNDFYGFQFPMGHIVFVHKEIVKHSKTLQIPISESDLHPGGNETNVIQLPKIVVNPFFFQFIFEWYLSYDDMQLKSKEEVQFFSVVRNLQERISHLEKRNPFYSLQSQYYRIFDNFEQYFSLPSLLDIAEMVEYLDSETMLKSLMKYFYSRIRRLSLKETRKTFSDLAEESKLSRTGGKSTRSDINEEREDIPLPVTPLYEREALIYSIVARKLPDYAKSVETNFKKSVETILAFDHNPPELLRLKQYSKPELYYVTERGVLYYWKSCQSIPLGNHCFHRVRNMPGRVRLIASSRNHIVILTTDGRLFATGDNSRGQLGILGREGNPIKETGKRQTTLGDFYELYTPQVIRKKEEDVLFIECGDEITLIATNAGLYATGYDQYGIGRYGTSYKFKTPFEYNIIQKVLATPGIVKICRSKERTTLLFENGYVWNTGQYVYDNDGDYCPGLENRNFQWTPVSLKKDGTAVQASRIYCDRHFNSNLIIEKQKNHLFYTNYAFAPAFSLFLLEKNSPIIECCANEESLFILTKEGVYFQGAEPPKLKDRNLYNLSKPNLLDFDYKGTIQTITMTKDHIFLLTTDSLYVVGHNLDNWMHRPYSPSFIKCMDFSYHRDEDSFIQIPLPSPLIEPEIIQKKKKINHQVGAENATHCEENRLLFSVNK